MGTCGKHQENMKLLKRTWENIREIENNGGENSGKRETGRKNTK